MQESRFPTKVIILGLMTRTIRRERPGPNVKAQLNLSIQPINLLLIMSTPKKKKQLLYYW